ncbi:hypothetical protein NKDENANG_00228 [Candidatus Entotheonellaceae bacterium PAL068K]
MLHAAASPGGKRQKEHLEEGAGQAHGHETNRDPAHAQSQERDFTKTLGEHSHRQLKSRRSPGQHGFEHAHLGIAQPELPGHQRQNRVNGDKAAVVDQVHAGIGHEGTVFPTYVGAVG